MPAQRPYQPLTTFNFKVNLRLREGGTEVCAAEFSECDGLEMSIEPKSIREGGNNGQQIHLAGPVSYGQLSLKRGMTDNFDLWNWFEKIQENRSLRASGEVLMLSSARDEEVKFALTGCLPIKLKAPSLNAQSGLVAIEEMQIAYETLSVTRVAK